MGKEFFFWHNKWIYNETLRMKFTLLFEAVLSKDYTVSQVVYQHGGVKTWDIMPRRRFTDLEILEVEALCMLLQDINLDDEEDQRLWEGDNHAFPQIEFVKSLLPEGTKLNNFVSEIFPPIWFGMTISTRPKFVSLFGRCLGGGF